MEKASFHDVRTEQQLHEVELLSASLKKDQTLLDLMKKYNIPLEHLDTHPYKVLSWYKEYVKCLQCKGLEHCKQKETGYFNQLVDDGFLHVEKYACKYMRQKMQARKHLDNFLVNDMPEKMVTVNIKDIDLNDEKEEYVASYIECVNALETNKGIYLYGTLGSGKTYLSAGACNQYAKQGKKVAFIHYPTFIQRMNSRIQFKEYEAELDKLKYAYFLVIDEIGGETVTEWNRDSILLPLLNARYEKGLPTWFTSNEDLASLKTHFQFNNKSKEEEVKSLRIMDRIKAMAKPVELASDNRRVYR